MAGQIQPPTGTRDLYPVEAARRRFITEAWRRVSINHGFEEIDGPTFETTELYTKKSGEGIVSEIFGVFSGKDEAGVKALGEKLARGEDTPAPYALRPEFTPTLARMYAAKAASLPKPTKWFSVGPYFRAERPQRGRLREFLQWNADCIGSTEGAGAIAASEGREEYPVVQGDFEALACCIDLLQGLGLSPQSVRVRFNFRQATASALVRAGIGTDRVPDALQLLDAMSKLSPEEFRARAQSKGLEPAAFQQFRDAQVIRASRAEWPAGLSESSRAGLERLMVELGKWGISEWCDLDPRIARGLAYYTGMVFEVIVDGERAIAGGGRYDNLIELFGGPPTPAVGFGMGDVVLSLVLQDKGLMPSDAELLGLAGQWPDVFVIAGGDADAEAQVPKVLAMLRRGAPRATPEAAAPSPQPSLHAQGLHARRSYKTTKNVGKLLQDAAKANARFAVIIESATHAKIKDMTSGAQDEKSYGIGELTAELRRRLGRA